MIGKILTLAATSLVGLGLAYLNPPQGPGDGPPPPPKKGDPKKKGEPGPAGDLRKAYDLLKKLRADGHPSGRPEERLRDWTDRASRLYRDGVKAFREGDDRLAHEYGAAAHDLARAVDHARNATLFDGRDDDLPPPPDGPGPDRDDERTRRDLRHAYDRIRERLDAGTDREARYYVDAARDLYNAARRDAEAGRDERAGELARAAEAMTHVPEHLAHAADREPFAPDRKADRPDPKADRKEDRKKADRKFDRPEPKERREDRGGRDDLPPPL